MWFTVEVQRRGTTIGGLSIFCLEMYHQECHGGWIRAHCFYPYAARLVCQYCHQDLPISNENEILFVQTALDGETREYQPPGQENYWFIVVEKEREEY